MAQNFAWTYDMITNLIDLYREKVLLWDASLEDHKVRSKKLEAWQDIADTLNLDRHIVEKKVRMLVGQYRRELVKEATGAQSKWFAFSKLKFLGNAHEGASSNSFAYEQVSHENGDTKSEEGSNFEDSSDVMEEVARKRLRPMIREDAGRLREERRFRDEHAVFGELVAHKLRNITDPHAKATTEYLINKILYNAEIGRYDKSDRRNTTAGSSRNHYAYGAAAGGIEVFDNDVVYSDNDSDPVAIREHQVAVVIKSENDRF